MTFPTVAVVTTNLDSSGDSPASARSDLLDAVQKLDQMIAHVSTFAATLLDDADADNALITLVGTKRAPGFATNPASSVSAGDIRTLSNPSTGVGYKNGVRFRFSSLNDDNSTPYADAIDFSTYSDSSGGGVNALYLRKDTHGIYHKFASTGAPNAWVSKQIAYTDGSQPFDSITATGTVSGATATGAGTSSAVVGVASSSGFGVYGSSSSGVGVQGISNSSYGVQGISSSGGIGVYGESNNNYGVQGFSGTGTGLLGQTTSGLALCGSSGSGPALKLQPSSQPTTSVSDGSFYCSSTGQPYVRISGAWKSINVT